jgi:3-oxoacyl-[acyl-carrier-protein] synthase III
MKVGAFAFRLGQPRSIAALPELVAQPARLRRMESLGLSHYLEAEESLEEMIVGAAAGALRNAAVEAAAIDTVIYATSAFDQSQESGLIFNVLRRCGLVNARPLGIFLGFCTNFTYALELIEGMRQCGRGHHVLIFADSYARHASRVLLRDAAVGSDGVACAVVSEALSAAYEVRAVGHACDAEAVRHLEINDIVSYVRAYANGVRSSAKAALDTAGLVAANCAWLVTANFNRSVLRNVAELCGFPLDRLYDRNVAAMGHCNSADQLFALDQLLASDLEHGTSVLVTGPGEAVWGAAALKIVRPERSGAFHATS